METRAMTEGSIPVGARVRAIRAVFDEIDGRRFACALPGTIGYAAGISRPYLVVQLPDGSSRVADEPSAGDLVIERLEEAVTVTWMGSGMTCDAEPEDLEVLSAPEATKPATRPNDPAGLLNVQGAAERLGMSTHWVQKAVADGRLPCTRIGRSVRFTEEQLEAWVQRQAHGGE